MSLTVSVIDGMSNATDDDLSGFQTDFLKRAGVVTLPQWLTPFKGVQTGTPDKNSNVSAGVAYIPNSTTSPTQYFRIVNDASIAVAHSDTTSNPRKDAVVLFLDLSATPDANAENVASIEVVEGAEAGSPTAPSDGDITTALGASTWIRLYNVTIANPYVSTVNADIADTRITAMIDSTKLGGVDANGNDTFLLTQSLTIYSSAPLYRLEESDGPTDNKNWQFAVNGETLAFTIWKDDYSAGGEWMKVERNGLTIDSIWHPSLLLGTQTTMPGSTTKLFINDASSGQIRITAGGTSLYMGADINEPFVGSFSNNALRIITNATAKWAFLVDGTFRPIVDNTYSVGVGAIRPSVIYAATGTINTSDLTKKTLKDFVIDTEKFVRDIDAIAYTWKDAKKQVVDQNGEVKYIQKEENEKRTHFGYGAQHIIAALEDQGLTNMDFAGYTEDNLEDGSKLKGLRIDQVHTLQIDGLKKWIQKLQARIDELEEV